VRESKPMHMDIAENTKDLPGTLVVFM